MESNWKKGPLPPDTYYWGGVVPTDHEGTGFFFASFAGDKALILATEDKPGRILKPDDVAWYNNCLDLPPTK